MVFCQIFYQFVPLLSCSVPAIQSWPLSWPFSPSSPVQGVLSLGFRPCSPALSVSFPGCLFVVFYVSWLSYLVLAVLSWLSCPGIFVLWLSCACPPVLTSPFWIFCSGRPVLAVEPWLHVLTVLSSYQFHPGCTGFTIQPHVRTTGNLLTEELAEGSESVDRSLWKSETAEVWAEVGRNLL